MAAHDRATWHLHYQSETATCQTLVRPPVCRGVCPVNNRIATPACHCTCHRDLVPHHPYSGDTCHLLTGPIHLPYSLSRATCLLQELPCQLYGCTAHTISLPRGLYRLYSHPLFLPVWVFDQNAISFAYRAHFMK
jgi:hypothetical protein